jgi:hypothetical protein
MLLSVDLPAHTIQLVLSLGAFHRHKAGAIDSIFGNVGVDSSFLPQTRPSFKVAGAHEVAEIWG